MNDDNRHHSARAHALLPTRFSQFAFGFLPFCPSGFANEGQFLLMNSASLADMNTRIADQASKKKTANRCKPSAWKGVGELSRFRPNLLIGGPGITAYAEDSWQEVQIGTHSFFTAGKPFELVCCIYPITHIHHTHSYSLNTVMQYRAHTHYTHTHTRTHAQHTHTTPHHTTSHHITSHINHKHSTCTPCTLGFQGKRLYLRKRYARLAKHGFSWVSCGVCSIQIVLWRCIMSALCCHCQMYMLIVYINWFVDVSGSEYHPTVCCHLLSCNILAVLAGQCMHARQVSATMTNLMQWCCRSMRTLRNDLHGPDNCCQSWPRAFVDIGNI